MNVLIVDDEAPARNRLRQLLEEDGAHTVIGEAGNGKQALELAAEVRARRRIDGHSHARSQWHRDSAPSEYV